MKEKVLQAMREFGAPVNAGKIAEITGIDRILDLGGEVKVEKHEARALCYDPVEYIKEDLKIQEPGVELLRKCMGSVCEDYLTFDILKAYLADEEEDLYWSQGAVELIEKIGAQNWLIMQM